MVHFPPSLLLLPTSTVAKLFTRGVLPQYLQLHNLRGHMPHQIFTQELHAIGAQEVSQGPHLWKRVSEVPSEALRALEHLHNSYRAIWTFKMFSARKKSRKLRSKSDLISCIKVTDLACLWDNLPSSHWYSHQDLPQMITIYFTFL